MQKLLQTYPYRKVVCTIIYFGGAVGIINSKTRRTFLFTDGHIHSSSDCQPCIKRVLVDGRIFERTEIKFVTSSKHGQFLKRKFNTCTDLILRKCIGSLVTNCSDPVVATYIKIVRHTNVQYRLKLIWRSPVIDGKIPRTIKIGDNNRLAQTLSLKLHLATNVSEWNTEFEIFLFSCNVLDACVQCDSISTYIFDTFRYCSN